MVVYQIETYVAIRALCKLISKGFSPIIRTEIMVSLHKIWHEISLQALINLNVLTHLVILE